jgi:hypothetical protein
MNTASSVIYYGSLFIFLMIQRLAWLMKEVAMNDGF